MPDAGGKAVVEGTETMFFYSVWILFPHYQEPLFLLFGILVSITIIQRAVWAIRYL
jgi:hypothetical protein